MLLFYSLGIYTPLSISSIFFFWTFVLSFFLKKILILIFNFKILLKYINRIHTHFYCIRPLTSEGLNGNMGPRCDNAKIEVWTRMS